MIERKIGDAVKVGDTIAVIHANRENVDDVLAILDDAVTISSDPVEAPQLVHMILRGQRAKREYPILK